MSVILCFVYFRVIKSSRPLPQVRCQTFTETLLVWFFSFIIIVPRLAFNKINNRRCEDPYWHSHYSYYVFTESLVCILPLFSMIIVYTASFCVMMTRNLPTNQCISTKRRKQYKNMSKMFFMLVCVYIVCSAPHSVLIFVLDHKRHHKSDGENYKAIVKLYLRNGARILLAINHCINPYFYAKMHQSLGKYLHIIKKSLRRLTRRHQKDGQEIRDLRSSILISTPQQSIELINRRSIERAAEEDNKRKSSDNDQTNDNKKRKNQHKKVTRNMSTNSYLMY